MCAGTHTLTHTSLFIYFSNFTIDNRVLSVKDARKTVIVRIRAIVFFLLFPYTFRAHKQYFFFIIFLHTHAYTYTRARRGRLYVGPLVQVCCQSVRRGARALDHRGRTGLHHAATIWLYWASTAADSR